MSTHFIELEFCRTQRAACRKEGNALYMFKKFDDLLEKNNR